MKKLFLFAIAFLLCGMTTSLYAEYWVPSTKGIKTLSDLQSFNALTEKTSTVDADLVVIEDSAASYVKKRVRISNLVTKAQAIPVFVGEYKHANFVQARFVKVNGKYAYVSTLAGYFGIFNVSNPSSPSLISSYSEANYAINGFAVTSNYAFISNEKGNQPGTGTVTTLGTAVTGVGTLFTTELGLNSRIQVSGQIRTVIAIADNTHLTVSRPFSPDITTGTAFTCYYALLKVLDISNPKSITKVAGLEISAGHLFLEGNYLYAYYGSDTSGYGGIQVIDVSNPLKPTVISTATNINLPEGGSGYEIRVFNHYCYMTYYSAENVAIQGITIWDVSNPFSPVYKGRYGAVEDPTNFGKYTQSFVVDGIHLYISSRTFAKKITILNITDPASPTLVGTYTTTAPGTPYYMELAGKYLYISCFDIAPAANGLEVVDVSNPASPTHVTKYESNSTFVGSHGIYICGNLAYIACYGTGSSPYVGGFSIFDISGFRVAGIDAGSLKTFRALIHNDLNVGGFAKILGGLNVGSSGINSIGNISVSNPTPTLILADTTTSAKSLKVKVDGDKAYLQELAGSDGSLLTLLLNNDSKTGSRMGLGNIASPSNRLHVGYGHIRFEMVAEPTACTGALAGVAGNVDDGAHIYKITFVTAEGETALGVASNTVTVANKTINGQVSLTAIPTSSNIFVTQRKIYRTKAGQSSYFLLTTIADNTTTTYTDNTADSALGTIPSDWRQNTTTGRIYVNADPYTLITPSLTAFGKGALESTSGNTQDTAFGVDALALSNSGGQNSAFGFRCLDSLTGAWANCGFGTDALGTVTTSGYNSAFGGFAFDSATSGNGNNAGFGYAVGRATGTGQIAITTGDYNTLLGSKAGVNSATSTKRIAIGYDSRCDVDNGCVIGTTGQTIVLGLGTTNPAGSGNCRLHMSGDTFRLDTARTITTAIDAGNVGEICWDSSYIYVCIAANTWRRVAHFTW